MRKGGEGRQSAYALGEHLLMASEVMGLVKPYLSGSLGHRIALATRHMRFGPSPRLEFESVSGVRTDNDIPAGAVWFNVNPSPLQDVSYLRIVLLLRANLRLRNFSQASSFLPYFGLATGVSN